MKTNPTTARNACLAAMGMLVSTYVQAACDQIAPNPNPAGNTIVANSPSNCNGVLFSNAGTLTIGPSSIGTLANTGILNNTGLLNGVNWSLENSGVINNAAGSMLNTGYGATRNYTGAIFNNSGSVSTNLFVNQSMVNNSGNIYNDSTTNNTGTIINTGVFESHFWGNAGTLINYGGLQNNASFANNGGTVINHGTIVGLFFQSTGTTIVNGEIRGNAVSVNGGAIQGTGVIGGNSGLTVNGGTLAPGNSTGVLNVNGALSFNNGTLETEIGGTDFGQFDSLHVTGAVSFLAGTLEFDFLNGFQPHVGDSWTFLTADGGINGFENLASTYSFARPGVPDSFFQIAMNANATALTLTVAAPVPEPEIYAMLGLGLGLMGWVGRRRKQQAA